ncbi:5'-nucleotidase C-terminal domain-containing protein [Phaeobacter sp. B1627]|uniref:5'-nucleotidase C-terminal domain-containing protein n=1 Tax=Phaeobacter sp. B1627 TaxID=2583809 RepID=UPI00111A2664|nr:5'-nucleotidase C-terminal domain-containing protein [Phaeobacter sp. B1627]TNJ47572.1 bifunctional metallophosphatase/5'-nucleotidase [Phaeobacter sp. B1627]
MKRASNGKTRKAGRLRLLATSDVHSNLLSHDYYADAPNPGFGLSRTGSLIAQARAEIEAEAGISLLLDNGDWLQGTPLAEAETRVQGNAPPAVQAFELLGYDAVGLGNHEFNFGLNVLTQALMALPCPAICSNLRTVGTTPDLPVRRQLVLSRRLPGSGADTPPVRIGLFSVLPPQTMMWDADHLQGRVEIGDMVDCARDCVASLRAAGADVIVALAHTGLGAAKPTALMENALRPITALPGVDAAVGGHTHLLLPTEDGPDEDLGIPVVMPGSGGSHLGVIDLSLELREGRWTIVDAGCGLRAVSIRTPGGVVPLVPEAPALVGGLAAAHVRTRTVMAEPVGQVPAPQHSYFTFFGQDRALALNAAAQAAAVRPALAVSDRANLPLLSAVAPAKFGGRAGPRNYTDVPAGVLSRRHVADLYSYPNELRCIVIDDAGLRDWLEMSAGFFNHLSPAPNSPVPDSPAALLANPERAGHNFDVIFGLEYEIDPTVPAVFDAEGQRTTPEPHETEGRIRNLRWQGEPIRPGQQFAVAFNSYRSSGGGNFRMLSNAPLVPIPPQMVREAIAAYVSGNLPRDPLAAQPYPWRFSPDLGVEAIALTGPGARAFLHDLPEAIGASAEVTENGFLSLRLSL